MDKPIKLSYFSDILCIWAYIAQIRLDELKNQLGSKIEVTQHFISVFGNTEQHINHNWHAKGGYLGYQKHTLETADNFSHINVSPELWKVNIPKTSGIAHLFLKAAQLLESKNIIPSEINTSNNRTLIEELMWRVRCAFFQRTQDIGQLDVLFSIAESMQLPITEIEKKINDGTAMAELHSDMKLKETYKLNGSPSYVLNEGRQKLYGNVGYRVIEANVTELLENPKNEASWC